MWLLFEKSSKYSNCCEYWVFPSQNEENEQTKNPRKLIDEVGRCFTKKQLYFRMCVGRVHFKELVIC